MFKKIGLYYRTIKHLKPIQVRYRLWYMIREKFRKITGHSYLLSIPNEGYPLNLIKGYLSSTDCCLPSKTFTFLNRSHTFKEAIDWNIKKYGKLWCYNLNYFDYLHQSNTSKEERLKLIHGFINSAGDVKCGMDPYPISLRTINWIKFLSKHKIEIPPIDACLYGQYKVLADNIEYHQLGNHLLENGLSLLFGAFYFKDSELWSFSKEIITSELQEQVLDDGGHFERSVMYHTVLLGRVLDAYNLLKHNDRFKDQDSLKGTLLVYAKKMKTWLDSMTWTNGEYPEINDHIRGMALSKGDIDNYAERLGLKTTEGTLRDSGYRKIKQGRYEVLADMGDIGPDYQPGHAHSNIFSFLLRVNGQELITEVGTSTYENNKRREMERATSAHNTIMVAGNEQNETWSTFRVGRRGKVKELREEKDRIEGYHDGFRFLGVTHHRSFTFKNDCIFIEDRLEGNRPNIDGVFFLHFHPNLKIESKNGKIRSNKIDISFNKRVGIQIEDYKKAVGYNSLVEASKAVILFSDHLITRIEMNG